MARAHIDPVAWKKKVRRIRIIVITLVLAAALTAAGIYLAKNVIGPALRYAKAERAEEAGDLAEAIDRFSLMWDYKDARERAADLAFSQQPDDSFRTMIQGAELGDIVVFGRWEQDGNPDNGPEPIRWILLGEDQGRVLLWSEAILDQQPFHNAYCDVTWAECSLRTWLNETFYRTAFTPAEQLLIPLTDVETVGNSASNTRGGENTQDHVYILSFNELLAFAYFNPKLESIYAYPTAYAISQGAEYHDSWQTSPWWIRTPGIRQSCAAYCDMAGRPLYSGVVNHEGYGIRPIVWVFTGFGD